jgi:hypothetical protein
MEEMNEWMSEEMVFSSLAFVVYGSCTYFRLGVGVPEGYWIES